MYGISSRYWKIIYGIFLRHRDCINWIKLFGSGAVLSLTEDFEESSLPYTFDIIDYNK